MGRPQFLRALVFAALPFAASAQLRAATPPVSTEASAVVLRPLTLLKRDDLDFGALIRSGTAGTATLNPVTGAVTTTGGITATPLATSAARFVGAGSRKAPVVIRIPKDPITLTRSGGTETMTVSDWTLDGPATRQIGANQAFEFKVGARLYVGANQAEGTYVGTFNVTVQYP